MIQLRFEKISVIPSWKIEYYNRGNPIPIELTIGNHVDCPEIIYARNLDRRNLVEFRFELYNSNLFEFTIVSVDKESIIESSDETVPTLNKRQYYQCNLVGDTQLLMGHREIHDERVMRIFRGNRSVLLMFGTSNAKKD
jgi:hypothetical protein